MSNHNLTSWVERYFYHPSTLQKFLSYLLSPLSLIYSLIGSIRRAIIKPKSYNIPIISVGNLTVGGSGKTPFCIALSKEFEKAAIISRGYGRSSSGIIVVKDFDTIFCNVETSGDEAMLYAQSTKACVIVSEDRVLGIKKAKELGAKVIILDDGFGKVDIQKFDILIYPDPKPANNFTIPSGAYRESIRNYKKADLVVYENKDFTRDSYISNQSEKMILVTAISNPQRLDKYITTKLIDKFTFKDHHLYKKEEVEKLLLSSKATTILTTRKDAVKLQNFGLPLSILELDFKIQEDTKRKIKNYVESYHKQEDI